MLTSQRRSTNTQHQIKQINLWFLWHFMASNWKSVGFGIVQRPMQIAFKKIQLIYMYCVGIITFNSRAAKGTKMKEICIFSSRKATFGILLCFKPSSFKKSLVPYFLSPLDLFFRGLSSVFVFYLIFQTNNAYKKWLF